MSTDVTADLTALYRSVVPADVTSSPVATDVTISIATVIARAEEESSRLAAGSKLRTAVGGFVDLHLADRGLRRQAAETDDQARSRARTPPQAVTRTSILEAVNAIVGTRGSLDLAPATSSVETVLEAVTPGSSGNLLTLKMLTGGPASGSLDVIGRDHVFKFASGVTTVAQFETLIVSSGLVRIRTPDGVGTLGAGDALPKTSFSGASDTASMIEIPRDGSYYDRYDFMDRASFLGGGSGVVIVMIPASASARASVADAVRTKIAAGKIWSVLEYV